MKILEKWLAMQSSIEGGGRKNHMKQVRHPDIVFAKRVRQMEPAIDRRSEQADRCCDTLPPAHGVRTIRPHAKHDAVAR